MTEIDYLKCKLEDTEKAFDKLHKRHIVLLKQQGKLEKENEELRKEHKIAIDEMITDYKKLSEENEQLRQEKEYYRKYALLYLQDFDLYSDDFIETIRSIEGDEFADKMLKDRDEIISALKKEGLYE